MKKMYNEIMVKNVELDVNNQWRYRFLYKIYFSARIHKQMIFFNFDVFC